MPTRREFLGESRHRGPHEGQCVRSDLNEVYSQIHTRQGDKNYNLSLFVGALQTSYYVARDENI